MIILSKVAKIAMKIVFKFKRFSHKIGSMRSGSPRTIGRTPPCGTLSQLQTLNPQPSTPSPTPEIQNHEPSIFIPRSSTLNSKPSTLNPKHQTLHLRLSTLNPEHSTPYHCELTPSRSTSPHKRPFVGVLRPRSWSHSLAFVKILARIAHVS